MPLPLPEKADPPSSPPLPPAQVPEFVKPSRPSSLPTHLLKTSPSPTIEVASEQLVKPNVQHLVQLLELLLVPLLVPTLLLEKVDQLLKLVPPVVRNLEFVKESRQSFPPMHHLKIFPSPTTKDWNDKLVKLNAQPPPPSLVPLLVPDPEQVLVHLPLLVKDDPPSEENPPVVLQVVHDSTKPSRPSSVRTLTRI